MDLREFVHGALKDVVLGIQDAQKEEGIGNYVAPEGIGGHKFPENSGVSHSSRFISTVMPFDVAVIAERAKTGGGTAGIRIAVVEAKLGGEAETKDTTVSRVRFSVPDPNAASKLGEFADRRRADLKSNGIDRKRDQRFWASRVERLADTAERSSQSTCRGARALGIQRHRKNIFRPDGVWLSFV